MRLVCIYNRLVVVVRLDFDGECLNQVPFYGKILWKREVFVKEWPLAITHLLIENPVFTGSTGASVNLRYKRMTKEPSRSAAEQVRSCLSKAANPSKSGRLHRYTLPNTHRTCTRAQLLGTARANMNDEWIICSQKGKAVWVYLFPSSGAFAAATRSVMSVRPVNAGLIGNLL